MKKNSIILLSSLVIVILVATVFYSKGQVSGLREVEKIDSIPNFFKSQNFYFSGQPDEATFRALKSDGVTLVINLRSEAENAKHTEESFDEAALMTELGIHYVSIPMGNTESYNPETVEKVAAAIESADGKTLIHCTACGRVTWVWMAYLIKHCGCSVDEAIVVGKQMKYSFMLENLLGVELTMDIKK